MTEYHLPSKNRDERIAVPSIYDLAVDPNDLDGLGNLRQQCKNLIRFDTSSINIDMTLSLALSPPG